MLENWLRPQNNIRYSDRFSSGSYGNFGGDITVFSENQVESDRISSWQDAYRENGGDWSKVTMIEVNGYIGLRIQGPNKEQLATDLQASLSKAVRETQQKEEIESANRNQRLQSRRQNL